jgi:alpha-mannosidase
MRAILWPSASADYIARIAPSPEQQTIWRLPESIADPAPLSESERASVEAAADALTQTLRSLQQRFPPQGEVALTGHAHIDLAWLWPYEETRRKLRRTFHTALSLMRGAPDFRFNQSSAQFYAQIEADDPKLFAEIRARVAAGQWEAIGGMWVEPDANMPSGESLARQILYGQRYFQRAFGARCRVCWLPDSFGFSPALPQLLRQGGLDSFFTAKVNWSETNRFPHDLFWWEGLDGSRALAHTFDNPIGGYNGEARPGCIAPTWANFRAKTRHAQTLLSVGDGDGGGGPTPEGIEAEVALRDFPALPRARWSRVDDFFARAHESAAAKALPTWRGEIYLELHRATLTTQSGVKRKHRRAENALVAAETVAGLAHLMGAPAPASLEPLWRTLLKNEFHDILPGSSIREVHQGAEAELDSVVAAGLAEQQRALAAIAARLPPGEVRDALVVVNPSLSERPLRVTLADGGTIASADSIPPLAVRALDRAALAPLPGLEVGERRLENAYLRVELGEDGAIASLFHKPSGREALAGRGAQLWVYPQDKPRAWDAWDIEEDYAERGEELRALESLVVAENTPCRASLRVTRRWRHSRIVQTLALAANGRRLDIATWDRLARSAHVVAHADAGGGQRRAGDLRMRVRRRHAADPRQHLVGRGAVRGPSPSLRRSLRARLRPRAHQRRQVRSQRARQRTGAEPRALAGLSRPARRRGRAELHLCAHAARRRLARGRRARGGRRPQPAAADPVGPRAGGGRRRAARLRRLKRGSRRPEAGRGRERPDPQSLRAGRRARRLLVSPAARLAQRRRGRHSGRGERAEGGARSGAVRDQELAARAGVRRLTRATYSGQNAASVA